jgi:hypothetical protein
MGSQLTIFGGAKFSQNAIGMPQLVRHLIMGEGLQTHSSTKTREIRAP